MTECDLITNVAFVNLKGIQKLYMSKCHQITYDAFLHIKGIQNLVISHNNITDKCLVYLEGI